jgi:predicted kinase
LVGTVILVNGISATGKTTVGRRVALELGVPFLSKDAVKERLFDDLGWRDRAWAHQLSAASHAVLNFFMEEELRCARGFVIESNFNPNYDAEKFRRWQGEYGCSLRQLLCHARGDVVFERFRDRVESGTRHPGHCDGGNVEAFRDYLMAGRCEPLDIGAPVLEVDTTDFEAVDWGRIFAFARGDKQ